MHIICQAEFEYVVRGVLIEHDDSVRGFNVVVAEPHPISNLTYLKELDKKLKEYFDVKSVTILECKRYGW